jgi:DNA-binding response OmpR family regulator
MRILIADDNLVFQTVLRAMLTQWGYDVVIASDGDEAWRYLQGEDAPRLAILDWLMPGLDGIEVCRRVRAARPAGYTYILVLTSKTRNEDLAAAVEAGADDFVSKPFISVELRARLRVGCRVLDLERLVAPRRQNVGPDESSLSRPRLVLPPFADRVRIPRLAPQPRAGA